MVYDFDFFLNAGGPKTPITNSINRILGSDMLIILPLIGVLAGVAVGSIIRFLPRFLNSK